MKLAAISMISALAFAGAALAQAPQGGAPSPEMQAARDAMMKACAADAKTLCAGKEGRDQMMCLRENTAKSSAPCQEAMSKMPARRPAQ